MKNIASLLKIEQIKLDLRLLTFFLNLLKFLNKK